MEGRQCGGQNPGQEKPKAIAAVEGIGLSGQQHGATLLDKAGKVLRPCILWNDARSFAECKDIEAREPRARDDLRQHSDGGLHRAQAGLGQEA